MVFLEPLDDGRVHLPELATVALVKDNHHSLLKDGMVLVLLNEDGEFEDGDNEYMTIVTESNFVAIDDYEIEF